MMFSSFMSLTQLSSSSNHNFNENKNEKYCSSTNTYTYSSFLLPFKFVDKYVQQLHSGHHRPEQEQKYRP